MVEPSQQPRQRTSDVPFSRRASDIQPQDRGHLSNSAEAHSMRLADYFAIVGIDPTFRSVEALSDSPKTIEECEVIILEKKEVTLFKQQLLEARAACTSVNGVDVDPLGYASLKLEQESFLSRPENNPYPQPMYDSDQEKWLDLDGTGSFFLRLIYGHKNPVTEVNFHYISSKYPMKIVIPEAYCIEPIPVIRHDDPKGAPKTQVSKRTAQNGAKHNQHHGNFELRGYLDRQEGADTNPSGKVLCFTVKRDPKQTPISDVWIQTLSTKGVKMTGYRTAKAAKVNYRLGANKERVMFYKRREVLKQSYRPIVLDRYPPEEDKNARKDYPFHNSITQFCFPMGISLRKADEMKTPECFDFFMTNSEGQRTFGTCLIFDELLSEKLRQRLHRQDQAGETSGKLQTQKAICILSRFSFMESFKSVLCRLFQIHLSSNNTMPIERFIQNIMDEVALPDEGNRLVQYEISGETIPFFRPVDQYPPFVTKTMIENLFHSLDVDNVIEIFIHLCLERKVLLISRHKSLLARISTALMSLMYPLSWQQTCIPLLHAEVIEAIEAPFPFLIGVQEQIFERLGVEIPEEVTVVDLDKNNVSPMDSHSFKQQYRGFKTLRDRLVRATDHIRERPDPLLDHVDQAFFRVLQDPDDEDSTDIDEIVVRDAFLEFMQGVMSGYKECLKDPGENATEFSNSKVFFEFDKFLLKKDAFNKPHHFINKLIHTTSFGNFIETRSLGRSDFDPQMIHFDKLLKNTRTKKIPYLVEPFKERTVVLATQPNEEALEVGKVYTYEQGFPEYLERSLFLRPRFPQAFNGRAEQRTVYKSFTSNDDIARMHDAEWARYNAEIIYCLWFQVLGAAMPRYSAYSSKILSFAVDLLRIIQRRLSPMREAEIIYRRLFEVCGICHETELLQQLNAEMKSQKHIDADKVTYGTYYQAILLSKGDKSGIRDQSPSGSAATQKRSYFPSSNAEQYIVKDNPFEEEKEKEQKLNAGFRAPTRTEDEFDNIFAPGASPEREERGRQQRTIVNQEEVERELENQKLSSVLENSLCIKFSETCTECEQPLREEELLSGLQKNKQIYMIQCPICKKEFVPKITLYSEHNTDFINGKAGTQVNMLPPVTLYKELLNIFEQQGDDIIISERLLKSHKIVFWNLIVYFKMMKLPVFLLNLDFSDKHLQVQVSWIQKYLPDDRTFRLNKQPQTSSTRSSFGSAKPRLDMEGLQKLDQNQNTNEGSPKRKTSLQRFASGIMGVIKRSASKGASKGPNSQVSNSSAGGPNSLAEGGHAPSGRGSGGNTMNKSHRGSGGPIQLSNLAIQKTSNVKSGTNSMVTSASDLEKFERIMSQARHANKNFVKQFGKHLEDFRRENFYLMELILSDLLTKGIPDSMIRHAEHVNIGGPNRTSDTGRLGAPSNLKMQQHNAIDFQSASESKELVQGGGQRSTSQAKLFQHQNVTPIKMNRMYSQQQQQQQSSKTSVKGAGSTNQPGLLGVLSPQRPPKPNNMQPTSSESHQHPPAHQHQEVQRPWEMDDEDAI